MTHYYLLDTNVLSESLRPVPNPGIISCLREHQNKIATAAPVWHELVFGCRRLPDSKKRRAIEEYLYQVVRPTISILSYTPAAAEWHAAERARLTGLGKPPPFVDGQIAAIAQVNSLVIVTANVNDYIGFEGVQIESWQS